MFTPEMMEVIRYCTEECIRQQSGMASVYNMINSWDWADWQRNEDDSPKTITVDFITHLGMLVEPIKNIGGIRHTPISIGYEVRDADRLPERLGELILAYYEDRLDPTDKRYKIAQTSEDVFYFEYEQIHCFVDGNGRSGKILYNYLLNTMDAPKLPPNFFNVTNL